MRAYYPHPTIEHLSWDIDRSTTALHFAPRDRSEPDMPAKQKWMMEEAYAFARA